MDGNSNIQSNNFLEIKHFDQNFTEEVNRRSGSRVDLCWQCKTCTNGCPFLEAMDYHPNFLIRLVQYGLKDEALNNSTIWICVGCNTCSSQCPNGIDISAVTDTLREIAIKENISIAEPDILRFHKEVLNSIKRYGKTHKLEIMLRYKTYKRDFFSDVGVGLKMLTKHKLDILPSKNKDIKEIRDLFKL